MTSNQVIGNVCGQQFHTTILEKMYLDSKTADVYFVFDSELQPERVPAHESLLSSGSRVFDDMFYAQSRKKWRC